MMCSWCNISSRQMDTGDSVCWYAPSTHGWSAVCIGLIPGKSVYSLGGNALVMLQAGLLHACDMQAADDCVLFVCVLQNDSPCP